MCRKVKIILIMLCLPAVLQAQQHSPNHNEIDLAGNWGFQIDSLDKGVTEEWFSTALIDRIILPGSMLSNNKGNEVTINTKWTGSIWDSLWYKNPEFEKYRQAGNTKIAFWLQPDKHYVGVAWYQKKVVIPAGWNKNYISLFLERCHWETSVWVDKQYAGVQNALATPHNYNLSEFLTSGTHTITIKIDNRVKEVNPGFDAHSISDNTQTNWNGIIGKMALIKKPSSFISNVILYPNAATRQVRALVEVNSLGKQKNNLSLQLQVSSKSNMKFFVKPVYKNFTANSLTNTIEVLYQLPQDAPLWDEFTPNVYTLKTVLVTSNSNDTVTTDFGLRDFEISGTRFTVNGKPIFLRGTLECAIFPKTGFPPVDVDAWDNIYKTCKAYGLNHVRFHSWCPPEAAFIAADKLGIYLSIEASAWADVGDGKGIDQYVFDESERIVQAYGNHPSFVMMPYGNEAHGKNAVAYLSKFVKHWQQKDSRRKYTSAAGFPVSAASDFANIPDARIQRWAEGVKSIINAKGPSTSYTWAKNTAKDKPTVSHEIGQWWEVPDYDGLLKPKNFDIFQDFLTGNGMGALAGSFVLASGKLQVLCYKADIEAALRTPGFAGFQLLGLQDFPGQGTAIVGVVDPFWKPKAYINGNGFKQFCNTVVPLASMNKLVYESDDTLSANISIANFTSCNIDAPITWEVKTAAGNILWKGAFAQKNIPIGNEFYPGQITQPLNSISGPQRLIVSVTVAEFTNSGMFSFILE